jgi:hypothetical protein
MVSGWKLFNILVFSVRKVLLKLIGKYQYNRPVLTPKYLVGTLGQYANIEGIRLIKTSTAYSPK